MNFELPAQLKGPECRRVITQVVALRRRLLPWFDEIFCPSIDKLAIILRVDGTVGSFGKPGVENVLIESRAISCELVVPDFGWDDLSSTEIFGILVDHVITATAICLKKLDIEVAMDDLRTVAEGRG